MKTSKKIREWIKFQFFSSYFDIFVRNFGGFIARCSSGSHSAEIFEQNYSEATHFAEFRGLGPSFQGRSIKNLAISALEKEQIPEFRKSPKSAKTAKKSEALSISKKPPITRSEISSSLSKQIFKRSTSGLFRKAF